MELADIASFDNLESFIAAAAHPLHSQSVKVARLRVEACERTAKMAAIRRCAGKRMTRPAVLLAGLRFCGPLTRSEICDLLQGRVDQWGAISHDADLLCRELSEAGFAIEQIRVERFPVTQSCIITRVGFRLIEE